MFRIIYGYFYRHKFAKCGNILILYCPYKIHGFSHIYIGKNFVAGRNLWLDAITCHSTQTFNPIIEIGNNVGLSNEVHIGCTNRIKIGNNVLIGSYVTIEDHNHGYYDSFYLTKHESPDIPPVKRKLTDEGYIDIEDNVWIGDKVSILSNTKIGKGSIIGANSVVKGEIPPNSIAAGVPAKVTKKYNFEKKMWIKI
ncbi:MAG: hypothetical protein BWK75_03640 [Candidatus Altiarchaeales archaeon A3]|nr:MAG: hypothetical protein BWK75_03640 [Candidatus Altiarchaeales archaeon A3]